MTRPLVLIADDYADACEMYAEFLRARGFGVVTAADGVEAVESARAHRPDVILLDLRMPRMSGSEALAALKADPAFVGVPIVALTAHAMREERESALAAGFDAFISKPIVPSDLARQVLAILGPGNLPAHDSER
jgi:two-component system cell cycle response regulator DivK